MPRRSEHSLEQIRELALDAVERLVQHQGSAGVSARKVAAEIGYTVGMLYHVFDNIDDLVLHANARVVRRLIADCQQAVVRRKPASAIQVMADRYLALAMDDTARWRLVFDHSMRDGAPVPEWYMALTNTLFDMVRVQLGLLSPTKSPRQQQLAAITLWSSVHGICLLAVNNKLDIAGAIEPRHALDSLLGHYLNSWAQA